MHGTDVFTTIAHATGAARPADRAIDGVNQLPFFEGKQDKSARERCIYFAPSNQVRAV